MSVQCPGALLKCPGAGLEQWSWSKRVGEELEFVDTDGVEVKLMELMRSCPCASRFIEH